LRRLETNTDIKYYIAASDSSLVPISGSTKWYPISPSNREIALAPKILDIGDLAELELENVEISYDRDNANIALVNPGQSFIYYLKIRMILY